MKRADQVSGDILAHKAFSQPVLCKASSVSSKGVFFICLFPFHFGVDTLSFLSVSKIVV